MTVAIVGAEFAPVVRALHAVGVTDVIAYVPAAGPAAGQDHSPSSRGLPRFRPTRPVPWRRVDIRELVFDENADHWLIRAAEDLAPARVVVLTSDALGRIPVTGRESRTLEQTWAAAPVTFQGVAAVGFPNLFFLGGPEPVVRPRNSAPRAQADLVAAWIRILGQRFGTRIEVRPSTQHEHHRRLASSRETTHRLAAPRPHHFDITVAADREPDHDYAGPAVLDLPGGEYPVHATLVGHLDPIDGRYHWYGRLDSPDADLPDPTRATAYLVLPGRDPAPARLTERDPWGNLRVTGVGTPPYAAHPG